MKWALDVHAWIVMQLAFFNNSFSYRTKVMKSLYIVSNLYVNTIIQQRLDTLKLTGCHYCSGTSLVKLDSKAVVSALMNYHNP